MIHVDWKPTPAALRRWALLMLVALGLVGSLFQFVEWGIFAGGDSFGRFLWGFGAVAFLTGITGTKVGLPAYWAWMGFVLVISTVISWVSLAVVYFLFVTPMSLLARVAGRDRLGLRTPPGASTFWEQPSAKGHDPERQF